MAIEIEIIIGGEIDALYSLDQGGGARSPVMQSIMGVGIARSGTQVPLRAHLVI